MEALEMNPKWVRRIGQPSMGECVGGEQVTEFIVDARFRNVANQ
jgi:hypothetical protein